MKRAFSIFALSIHRRVTAQTQRQLEYLMFQEQ